MKVGDDKAKKAAKKAAWWTFLAVLLLMLYQCGERAVMSEVDAYNKRHNRAPSVGYMENGYWVPESPNSSVLLPEIKSETHRRESADGRVIDIVTNCRQNELVSELEQNERLCIRHIDHGPRDRQSRCSYGFDGKIAPINGNLGRVVRPRFKEDLFFPSDIVPAEAMGFYMIDPRKKGLDRGYIKQIGGSICFSNPISEPVEVRMQLNLQQGETANKKWQIGWTGDTLHLEVLRMK